MADRLGLTEHRLVRCRCGVKSWAIDMTEVSTLPLEVRWKGEDAWCGGCRERAIAEGRITREAYLAALGAPAELRETAASQDAADLLAKGDSPL